MQLTDLSSVALRLGHRLAQYADAIYAEQYATDLAEMRQDLVAAGVDANTLPDSADAFRDEPFEPFRVVMHSLAAARGRLGGDVYALPFFILQYMLYRAVKHSALRLPFDDERKWLSAALEDLGLEAEDEHVQELIRTETVWIHYNEEQGNEGVQGADVVHAWGRISSRIIALWRESGLRYWQDLPTIGIDYMPQYSCFISYSFADEEFCKRLWERLRLAGVQVWFASHDMKGGQKIRAQVTDAIGTYDKLLLVLSDSSIKSAWVDHELYTAFHREKTEKRQVLFPIRLVPFETLRQWQAFDADTGRDLAREIREYFIPDFTEWRSEDTFDAAFSQLLDSLRRSEEKRD